MGNLKEFPNRQEPVPVIVETIEKLLKMAKNGEIRAFVGCIELHAGDTGVFDVGHWYHWSMAVGSLELIKYQYLRDNVDTSRELP
jgi:hypothetical protein